VLEAELARLVAGMAPVVLTEPGVGPISAAQLLCAWSHPGRLRSEAGKDIWLFGGGSLFRGLLEARQVDTVEVSVIPVLLGAGIPLLPSTTSSERFKLKLTDSRTFKTGIVSLEYAVEYEAA